MLSNMIINEHIADYIDSLESELPQYLTIMEEKALNEEVPIVRKSAQALLRFLLLLKQPKQILEVGTAVGFSSSFMSEYMPKNCKITTIEKVPKRIEVAILNFSKVPRKDDITLLTGDANDILRELAQKVEGSKEMSLIDVEKLDLFYDFIFMDAAKGQYMNFLPHIMKILPVGGLFITDNVLQEGSIAESKFSIARRDRTIHMRMREYLYKIKHMEELETIVLPLGDGITISVRIK